MVCLSRPHHFKFFEGCLPQVLLGSFLNTLPYFFQILVRALFQQWNLSTTNMLLAFLNLPALKSHTNCHGDVSSSRSYGPDVDVHPFVVSAEILKTPILGSYQCKCFLYLKKKIDSMTSLHSSLQELITGRQLFGILLTLFLLNCVKE